MYIVPVRPHFWPQPSGDLIPTFITCDLCACSLSLSPYFMWLSSLCRWYLCAYPLFAVCGFLYAAGNKQPANGFTLPVLYFTM